MKRDIVLAKLKTDTLKILKRALEGEELSLTEVEYLLRGKENELPILVRVADEIRKRRVGDIVTYVKNRNINHTNVCSSACKFCAFGRGEKNPDAYVLSPTEIRAKVREALEFGVTEICIQGGLHPGIGIDDYISILKAVREESKKVHIHAFSPAELLHVAKREGVEVEEVIRILKKEGLNSVPGTAAEILSDRVRRIICPEKPTKEEWIRAVKTCHELGVPTTATMMYGHLETPKEMAEHLFTIREIQMETRGFTEFVLLPFVPFNTSLWRSGLVPSPPSTPQNLRVHAVSRIVLDGSVNNIQASWVKLGRTRAKLMLVAGANDLGGTLMEENITRAAGGKLQMMTPQEFHQMILEVGRIPRERTTTYHLL